MVRPLAYTFCFDNLTYNRSYLRVHSMRFHEKFRRTELHSSFSTKLRNSANLHFSSSNISHMSFMHKKLSFMLQMIQVCHIKQIFIITSPLHDRINVVCLTFSSNHIHSYTLFDIMFYESYMSSSHVAHRSCLYARAFSSKLKMEFSYLRCAYAF